MEFEKTLFEVTNEIKKGIKHSRKAFVGPAIVQLDPTGYCNNSCIGCWVHSPYLDGEGKKDKNVVLDYKIIKKLLRELSQLGTTEIYISGAGEPFMHPDIMEIIELIKNKYNMKCNINTNGTLLNDSVIEKLVKWKVDMLTVSVWAGNEETYSKLHPEETKQSFLNIKNNLIKLKRYKDKKNEETDYSKRGKNSVNPFVKIYNVLCKDNCNEIGDMINFALEVEAERIEFQPIEVIENKTEFLELSSTQKQKIYDQIEEQIDRFYNNKSIAPRDVRNFLGDITMLKDKLLPQSISKERNRPIQYDINSRSCYIGWIYSRILSTGDVVPCCKGADKIIGDLYENDFSTIWFSEKYNDFRSKAKSLSKNHPYFKEFGYCENCDSVGHNKFIYYEMQEPPSSFYEMIKKDKGILESLYAFIGVRRKIIIKATNFFEGNLNDTGGQFEKGLVIDDGIREGEAKYKFEIPEDHCYSLYSRYASSEPRPVDIYIDNRLEVRGLNKVSPGYHRDDLRWFKEREFFLEKGSHILKIRRNNLIPHIERFVFVETIESKVE